VSNVINGKQSAGTSIAAALGFERMVVFRKSTLEHREAA
jgi:hypothetical protein